MSRFFHATAIKNIDSIKKEGLKPIWDYVYLTDSLESATRWMGFRFKAQGESTFAVIEIEFDPKKLKPGMDHSPIMQQLFGCGESLTYDKTIPSKNIIEIHLYSIQ